MIELPTKNDDQIKAGADPRVLHPLDTLRGAIRRYVLVDGLAAALFFLTVWFWGGLVADFVLFKLSGFDWVTDAPWTLRAIVLGSLLLLLGSVVYRRVLDRLKTHFSYPSLALVLEKRFPKILGDRLITAVELADVERAGKQGYSMEMIRATIEEARERVAQVPVDTVFNWGALRTKFRNIALIFVGGTILAFLGCGLSTKTFSPLPFLGKSYDVAMIWSERNLLLMNTAWPRRAHLELVGFPEEKGLRIGIGTQASKLRAPGANSQPPRIRARAFRYVVADSSTRVGWRPLLWSEANRFASGVNIPTSTIVIEEDSDWSPLELARAALVGANGIPGGAVAAGTHRKQITVDLNKLTADEVFEQYADGKPDSFLPVFAKLDESADRAAMSRTFRKLEIPDRVTLTYFGKKYDEQKREMPSGQGLTSGEFHLSREPNGEFTTDVTPFKETVGFVLRADDYKTKSQDVILVTPPLLVRLFRQEMQPAYLHHAPAVEDITPEGDPNFAALKGLRQKMSDKDLSLTGDKSTCAVPAGTDLRLTAQADKSLKAAYLLPKTGKLPGATASGDPIPVPVQDKTLTIHFEKGTRIQETVEFDLLLVDNDDVESIRPITIQANEDQAPTVELLVDGIRKVGNSYYCTPRARIPFVKESLFRDDTGISSATFQVTVAQDTRAMMTIHGEMIAAALAFAPLRPTAGDGVSPLVMATLISSQSADKAAGRPIRLKASPLEDAFKQLPPRDTMKILKQKLESPLTGDVQNTVRFVKFADDKHVLDLEEVDKLLQANRREKLQKNSGEFQPRFKLELNLLVRDANFETGPKEGKNLEPIRILVLAEGELLIEVGKDEEAIAGKLNEQIAKMRNVDGNLGTWVEKFIAASMSDDVHQSAQVRVEDMLQETLKSRDAVLAMVQELNRLRREMEINRVGIEREGDREWSKNALAYEQIAMLLDNLVPGEYKALEDSLTAMKTALAEKRTPGAELTQRTRDQLLNLILKLTQAHSRMGDTLDANKMKLRLEQMIRERKEIEQAWIDIIRKKELWLKTPVISVQPIEVAKGNKVKVVHKIDWKQFAEDKFVIKIEPESGSGLQTPAEVSLSDGDMEYELTAGTKEGKFKVTLTPTVGEPLNVEVTVR